LDKYAFKVGDFTVILRRAKDLLFILVARGQETQNKEASTLPLIETWEAQRLERIILFGRTKPLLIECWRSPDPSVFEEDEELIEGTDSALCVVKGFNLPEVNSFGLFCEVFGNLLARQLGLDTPAPCLVHLSEPFVNAVNPILGRNGLNLRPGIASGCEYFSGGYSNVVPPELSFRELEQATSIYAFDLLVQNPDRLPQRPNCAVRSGDFKVYDFETAFSFALLIGDVSKPWEVSRHGIGAKHLFHSALQRNKDELNWKPFIEALKRIDEDTIDGMMEGLPQDWLDHAPKVRAHLLDVVKNARRFEFELQRSLS